MSFQGRSVDDLCRIARAGGGFRISNKGITVDDLCRIGRAAAGKRAHLAIVVEHPITTDDLCRISRAGDGCVSFE